jgi:large subunit ribosomal protein L7/L12
LEGGVEDMADENKKEEEKKEEKAEKATSKGVEKLVDEISKLSVLELSELVNTLQDKLGVTAMPMAAAPAAGAAAPAEGEAAGGETGGGNLIITGSGDNKIAVIKALREINQNWGLKEAKDMTEQLPAEIIKDGKAEEVKEASEKLKAAGATVEVK